ncbi:hypothetical protein ACFL27_13710 [candidate division CSSED10-310 bacterium]|uniref:Uncharacterized protein n=1 Tax=candidate division CSSED10-310 bacterium TaxID=2855610 RepID=A0ABV6YYI9_UNCC1
MSIFEHDRWFITIGENDEIIDSLDEVRKKVVAAQSLDQGSINLCAAAGPRPWWHRIFGTDRFIRSYFICEWYGDFAAIIFLDEKGSEYRAIDEENQTNVDVEVRKNISFGNYVALQEIYCLTKRRAFSALIEFIETGIRPDWLSYKFFK